MVEAKSAGAQHATATPGGDRKVKDGLEVVEPSGHHVLVPVRTGVFAGGEVEVNGAGIAAGDRVVVAQ